VPGLFSIYGLANRALMSFQTAMSVVGHNVSNADTAGFHRQRVELRAGSPVVTSDGMLGTGVQVQTVQRVEDRFIESALQREVPLLSRYSARSDALSQSQLVFGEPSDSGLTAQLDAFFTGWDDLASNPEDPAARESVVRLGMTVADSVRSARTRLTDQQDAITADIGRSVDDANRAMHELQNLNTKILASTRDGVVPGDLEDRRDQLAESLADLLGATTQVASDGTATVRVSGRVIVQAGDAQTIAYDPSKSRAPTLDGRELTDGSLDGRIGGLVQARDGDLAALVKRLDEFAARLAQGVNDLHTQGKDANGDAALPFFVVLGVAQDGVSGAAGGLQVNAALVADSSKVAAGSDGSVADNGVALDIAGLRAERSGASDMLQSLVVDAASRAREAQDLSQGQQVVVQSFQAQRESVSGVSLDEEGAKLLQYQRSYQAAARVLTAVDEMTQTILAI
jgi:flagellar hook-associated protein 1